METLNIPAVYRATYEKARVASPQLAARYIDQTTVDDPVADAVMEALADFEPRDVNRFIRAGMQQDEKALADAPDVLCSFFRD